MDNDIHSLEDISQILEYTLHRMVDAGFTESEIRSNSGMFIPTPEQLQELEEFDEYTNVDLGYILGGLILNIK
jgi:DNA-binding PadR family transcriptional regulator